MPAIETPPAAPPARLHSLDGLRASMMLLGIVIHGVLPYLPDPESKMPFHDARAANLAYLLVILFIHTFRMPIFFVMAGFFAAMMRDRRGAGGLLRDRFRRIVAPFAVGWAVAFPVMKATNAYFRAGGGGAGLARAFDDLVGGRLYAEPDLSYFLHVATVLATSLIAWLFVFGITGLFVRHLSRPSPSMRYLTDASYWCYLVHVPIIYWVAALLAPLSLASPLKVMLLMALALAAYHFAVRSTLLGEHLDGRRYPRRLPWRELAEGGGAS